MPSWTTLDHPTHEQFGYWREVLCEAFITLNPGRKGAGGFRGEVTANLLSGVNVTTLVTEEHRVIRGPAEIRKSPLEYYFVNMQIRGDVLAKQRGRETLIRPNEFYIVDSTEPYDLDYRSDLEIYSFRIPKQQLEPLLRDPSGQTALRVSRETPLGMLAVDFLQSVIRLPDTIPSSAKPAIARMMTELVALSLGGHHDAMQKDGTVAGAMLTSILGFIDQNLSDPSLSVETVCRRFAISPRYLHRLFESCAMTFGESLRNRRLELCASELSSRSCRPISSIALSWGFNDISHFNHSFRKRFGVSPREYANSFK
ncbi:helix-turn-helix domain-containing protein [Bradyrhizobium liaoningense]|uniref:helix-turn-helix domain-containing protein n=1 Tax=Bradyrhizobium liaoningense TaxID=43992 RepID=UPI001BA8CC55|nr:helix-turn-helix domain-containing protein [Bradyrhizobium liaoningense]MBR0843271.1 helix-turn-helix domain-containing protein [Bradyrhizobium liaoningense]